MIVVKIDLHSAITGNIEEIGRMYIANDGSGSAVRGNYNVGVCRKGNTAPTENIGGIDAPARAGKVLDYPRTSYNVWRLISRALLSAFPEEQTVKPGKAYESVVNPEIITGLTELAILIEKSGAELSDKQKTALDWLKASME